MPTYTTIAWETLLEPRLRDSYTVNSKQQITKSDNGVADDDDKEKNKMKTKAPNHIYISPALYVTPEPPPVADSSFDSLSPSPYVVTRKRRGGGGGGEATDRRVDGFEIQQQQEQQVVESNSSCGGGDDSSNVKPCIRLGQQEVVHDNFLGGEIVEDDFFGPLCDSVSVASSVKLNDSGKIVGNISGLCSHGGEFFDADEDFFSDDSISNVSSSGPCIESELRATRLSLLDEIDRRKAAEDALRRMYSQWQRVGNALSEAGLTFPAPPTASDMQLEINSVEQFSQEIVVARFVAEAIGRGQACAEAELTAEAILESKDQEISRLRDKLQYYEAVNHEMSQRNQEIVEVARRQRKKKKSQRKWLWSCIGLSVAIGASLVAYSYLPQTSTDDSSLTSSDSPDESCVSSS